MRAAGVEVRVLDPVEVAMERRLTRGGGSGPASEAIADPALAGWLYGSSWVTEQGEWSSLFRVIELPSEPHRAWFLPLTAVARPAMLETWSGEVWPLLELFHRARPVTVERHTSQVLEVNVETDEAGWIIVTQLADPQWHGRWIVLDTEDQTPAEIVPAFRRGPSDGGWQRVRVPGPGRWTLRMEYRAVDIAQGLGVSATAALLWVIALVWATARSTRRDVS
jgi:hypothetical protein